MNEINRNACFLLELALVLLSPFLILAESVPKYVTLSLPGFVLLLPFWLLHGSQRSHRNYSDAVLSFM